LAVFESLGRTEEDLAAFVGLDKASGLVFATAWRSALRLVK
jgi:hypothetical protein